MSIAILCELEHEIHRVILSGSQLLNDNFRLQRLQTQLCDLRSYAKPLGQAADLLQNMLESEETDRVPNLLRLASLVQAMQVTLCESLPLQPLLEVTEPVTETQVGATAELIAPSGQNMLSGILLHRVRETLNTKGSGRLEALLRLHTPPLYRMQQTTSTAAAALESSAETLPLPTSTSITSTAPETAPPPSTAHLDARLILPLLHGLDDDYSEIRNLCFAWLQEFGPVLLPLLEQRIEVLSEGRSRERLTELHVAVASDSINKLSLCNHQLQRKV